MPPPKPATSTSTENLLLKCQKETRKKCLPPEWSIYPPNQPTRPPPDTLALAIQIDASSPSAVTFYESATDRLVGSIGSEYRGSIVVVPWRPGLKFVCQSTCRRRTGCRIGVVREAKGRAGVRMKSVGVRNITNIPAAATVSAVKSSASAESKKSTADAENAPPAAPPKIASPTSKSGYISRIPRRVSIDKPPATGKHVTFDDKSISGKSPIQINGGRLPRPRAKSDVKPGQRS
ncbi:hypothetical protein T069G_09903 [Trichoderma breve]|uniref:Uncharacterized protein n=1 Tax=Trichoderma breve TaxID=2034170 RepID=A0A9W9E435_9HYPO|nr:hypothetical protein T069G_09903 [Trichoderma breve]KAJ4856535.1 hypothetical protein T069G_09903 [Trichoderma breve]